MTDEMNDWPYTELGSHPTPKLKIADLLRDQGWDDDIESVYGPAEDSDDFDELDYSFDPMFRDRCECRIVQLFSAADDLKAFLEKNVKRFPRTIPDVEGFAGFGGRATGSWSKYVNTQSSVPFSIENGGSIHLFGCSKKGHSCRILMHPDESVTIKADKPERSIFPRLEPANDIDDEIDNDLVTAREARDEELYDRRTFGDLDDSDLVSEEDEDRHEMISLWRDFFAPEAEISAFMDAGLEPEEVVQLFRYMPRSEVLAWVEDFGGSSLLSLEFLKIGLGELSTKEELEDFNFDNLRTSIAKAIREAIIYEFAKKENGLRIVEKKKPEEESDEDAFDDDEFMDLDDDPYWDDDL
jgi:hypothetical protein